MSQYADTRHIDEVLAPWRATLGADYSGYRNHVVRMATFCLRLRACSAEAQQKIEIAACFHDLGIWIDNTLDYLAPSVPPARDYLAQQGLAHWGDEIEQMILDHHKLRPVTEGISPLVELFRQGDLVDFSRGLVRFGLSRSSVREVMRRFPNAGFHRMLMRRLAGWVIRHPLNPAPMMKW